VTLIQEHIQKSNLGALVTLFQLDLTGFGDMVYYLYAGDQDAVSQNILFGGHSYLPLPLQTSGWETTGEGTLPRPTVTIANINSLWTALVTANKDLLGAPLTRIRTFDKFLDGGSNPDPTATLPIDQYILTRKTKHNRTQITWELSASMDQAGTMLPGRVMVRDYCDQIYRRFVSGTTFDYTQATCPYAGTTYLDAQGNSVAASKDQCGKHLADCKARFGVDAVLPFRGFPGAARLKIR
jgi:lambda family phage minor tail protein L